MIGGDVACVYGEQSPCVFPSLDSHPQLICNRGGAQKWVRQFARRLSTFSSIRSTKIPNFAHLHLHWSVIILQFIYHFPIFSPLPVFMVASASGEGDSILSNCVVLETSRLQGMNITDQLGHWGGCRYWYRDSTAIRWFEMQSTYICILCIYIAKSDANQLLSKS